LYVPPKREFLYVDDLAEACFHLMINYNDNQFVNIGTGEDVTIKELTELVKDVVGFKGEVVWDSSKPDGTPRKLMDVSKIHEAGWKHTVSLEDGIKMTYETFLSQY
jgi:GDP-L-fucose synthase